MDSISQDISWEWGNTDHIQRKLAEELAENPQNIRSTSPEQFQRSQIIQDGMKKVLRLLHWGKYDPKRNYDLREESVTSLDVFGRKIVCGNPTEFREWCNTLKSRWGIILLDHPDENKIFTDGTSAFSQLPRTIIDRMVVITYDFQYPMNSEIFERDGKKRFIPAQATKEYIKTLKVLQSHVARWGIVFLMPKWTEQEAGERKWYQGTFRKMILKWDKNIPVMELSLKHSKPNTYTLLALRAVRTRLAKLATLGIWNGGTISTTTVSTKNGTLEDYEATSSGSTTK